MTADPTPLRGPWSHPPFARFQAARFAATVAFQVQSVAVAWQLYTLRGRALDLGLAGLAQFLPVALLSVPAGNVADRVSRRTVVASGYAVSLLGTVSLLAMSVTGTATPARLLAVLVLLGSARAFAQPAAQALLPMLVPGEQLARAIAWGSTTWQVAAIAGPSLGGVLVAAPHGWVLSYATAALSLATSVSLLLGLPPAADAVVAHRASRPRLLDGLRYVRARSLLLGSISLDLFAVLLGGAVALLPVYARDILHAGPWGLGLLRAAPSAGATAMAVHLARHPVDRHVGRRLFESVACFGVATIVFGVSRVLPLSLLALVVLGAADMVSVVIRQTLVQARTPPSMRGRVSAVNMVFIGASNELGEFESGLTAAWWGATTSVVAGGIGTLLVVVVWRALFPALREIDRLPEPETDDGAARA